MSKLCERPGCSAPADVAYGFDTEHLTVWLDHLTAPGAARAGSLCRRHADAMVVPLQWTLDDRREAAPRLFPSRRRRSVEDGGPTDDVRGGGRAHGRERSDGRRRRPRVAADESGQLAFDALGPAPRPEVSPGGSSPSTAPDATDHPSDGPALGVPAHVHDAPAEDLSEGDTPEDDAAGDDAPGEDRTSSDVDGPLDATSPLDRPATPWQPVFDQRDDLDGLLSARGSLLSRAFRGTPRPGD